MTHGALSTPFARLHRRDEPLLLRNAWDHASAMALAAQGFPAVGTTSRGVAAALETAADIRAGRTPRGETPMYDHIQGLVGGS